MIWLPSSGRLEVAFKDLMQALSTSFGSTGLRRKSETRIWSSQRTSASSKASATTITGGAAESAHGDALEGDQALAAARIDVDDDDRGGVDLGALRRLLDALRHDRHRGCMDAAGGAGDGVEEARIRPDEQDRRRLRGGVVHLVVLRAKTRYVLVRGGRGARHRHRDGHDRRRCPAAPGRTRRLVAVDRVDDAPAADLDLGPG